MQDDLIKPDVNDNTLRITNKGLQFLGMYNRLPDFVGKTNRLSSHTFKNKLGFSDTVVVFYINLVEFARLKDREITTNLRRASQITIEQLNFVECFVYK